MDVRWPDWIAALEDDTRTALAAHVARQRFPAGAALFFEGDPAHHVLVIQRGEVKVTTSSLEGREVVLDVLEPGAVLGELAAMDGGTRSATAVALTEVEAAAIPSTTFRDLARAHPALLEALLTEVVRRLRVSDRRQLEFGGDALGRVCARLVELADRQGGTTELVVPVNQSELAAWTGLSREAVVKALATLRRLGWLRTEGRRYSLLRPAELRARANQ